MIFREEGWVTSCIYNSQVVTNWNTGMSEECYGAQYLINIVPMSSAGTTLCLAFPSTIHSDKLSVPRLAYCKKRQSERGPTLGRSGTFCQGLVFLRPRLTLSRGAPPHLEELGAHSLSRLDNVAQVARL